MDLCCQICHDTLLAIVDTVAIKCGHVFHSDCLANWCQQSKTCPSCRRPAAQDQLIRLYFTSGLSDQRRTFELENKLIAAESRASQLQAKNNGFAQTEIALRSRITSLNAACQRKSNEIKHLEGQLRSKESYSYSCYSSDSS